MGLQGQQGWLTIAIYFGVFLGVFYFFIIIPRKKQEKKHKETLESLKRGDRVVTIGGLRGEIAKIKEDVVLIKINDSTEIEFLKNAIAYKVEDK
jgi:preprotein translocase subunit YajC